MSTKNYAENAEEDSDPANEMNSEDDESFDEDDDPDKIEVPGGGKTLEAAKQIKKASAGQGPPPLISIKQEIPGLLPASKMGKQLQYPTGWPGSVTTAATGLTASQLLKQETMKASSSSAAGISANLNTTGIGSGGTGVSISVPSPLLDTSMFLRMSDQSPQTQQSQQPGVGVSNPLESLTQNFFAKFLSSPAFNNPNFAQVYNALLGGNLSAASLLSSLTNPALMGLANLPQKPKVPAYNQVPPNNAQWNGVMAGVNYDYLRNPHNPLGLEEDDEAHDDDTMGVAETYADYKPAKCMRYILSYVLYFCTSFKFFTNFLF